MSREAKRVARSSRWLNLGSFLALLGLWLLLTTPLVAPLFLPSPLSVAETFLTLM